MGDLDGDDDLKNDGDDCDDDNEIMTWGCVSKCTQWSSWCPKDRFTYFLDIQVNQQLKNKSS